MSQLISAIGSIFANPFGQYMVNRQAENAYQDVFNQVRNANIQTGNQIAGLYGLGPLPQTSMLPAGMYSGYNVPQFGGLGFNPFAGTQGFGGGRPSGTYGPQGGGSFGPYSPVAPLTPESRRGSIRAFHRVILPSRTIQLSRRKPSSSFSSRTPRGVFSVH